MTSHRPGATLPTPRSTETSLAVERKQDQIDEEARLDGIYVIRTPVADSELGTAAAVTAYKNLKHVERDFCHINPTTWTSAPSSTG